MSVNLPARGCVYRVDSGGKAGAGWYAIKELPHGVGDLPILVNSFTLDAVELAQPIVTLDNSKILYTFGADFSAISVFGEILLGEAGSGGGQGLQQLYAFYKENRVGAKKNSIRVSGPGVGHAMYLTGLQVGNVDPMFHTQPWVFQGVVAETVGDGK